MSSFGIDDGQSFLSRSQEVWSPTNAPMGVKHVNFLARFQVGKVSKIHTPLSPLIFWTYVLVAMTVQLDLGMLEEDHVTVLFAW